jgi:parvulin-like peptidyl-prolyl isomerase
MRKIVKAISKLKIEKKLKKVRWSTIIYAMFSLAIVFFLASVVAIYALPRSIGALQTFAESSPYPLVVVDHREVIAFRDLSQNMASIKRFYESQDFSQVGLRVDFTTEEGQQRFKVREKEVLNKMIEDAAIIRLAQKRGLTVTDDDAAQSVRRQLEEYGSADEVTSNLERLYGWTLDDFQEKIVVPSLYKEKLMASFQKEIDTSSAAQKKIDVAQQSLRNGSDFSDVAKQYSDGQTAADGGELGWLSSDDLAPELRQSVASQKVGVPGGIIESSLGYHIVLVEELKKENDRQLYRVRQIFAKKVAFADWLTSQMKSLSVWVLSPEYHWNTDEARVDFKSQELRDFEKDLYKKTSGDALFFF